MVQLTCPVVGCDWTSQDLDVAFAAALTTALQLHEKDAHPGLPAAPPTKLKLDSPSIGTGCDPDQWSAFKRQWDMYKVGMAITAAMVPTALFYCCDFDLRTDIMRDIQSDVSKMPEAELLSAIKRLAVKEESTLVHRMKLNRMTQSPATGIRTFLAALRGQAALCQYKATCKQPGCTHVFDYSEEIIKDNLIRGIADPEILSDLLGDSKTDRNLDETVAFIAQKEQGKVTKSAVGDSLGAVGVSQPNVQSTKSQPNVQSKSCWACGGPAHGVKNDRKARAKYCEAWTFTCVKCAVKGHFSSCCSKCVNCGSWGHRDSASRNCPKNKVNKTQSKKPSDIAGSHRNANLNDASYVFDQLCTTSVGGPSNEQSVHRLQHHVFEGKWIPRPSQPHPVIALSVTPVPQDHMEFGYPIKDPSKLKSVNMTMIADTGCQSSIIPLQSVYNIGFTKQDLLPVRLTMRGAIKEDLGVIGAIVIDVATTTPPVKSTRLFCYVSDTLDKAFLCREALTSLGIIHPGFPICPPDSSEVAVSSPVSIEVSCSCPRRQSEPPPLPTELPPGLEATEGNVENLRQWLLDYYGSTVFNVCEHQPLPLMSCDPLQLHVDPNARPIAVHKPALVPIHWQERVHADLERDVRIGVLERVSPNTPTTWCSRMVVTSKSDGTPRRTVDLQPLNRCSVRQTHHVPTPFHLADRVPQHTKKTVTDAWNGYHSVPIREEDRHYTTFITPWGRYRYKVAPQGFLASGDAYTQRFDAIIADFENKVKCVDDTCMWADSIQDAFFQACRWFDMCARNGITLNPEKFQFAQDTVDFAGLTITPTNIRPSSKFIDAIRNFPVPTDITGARAWFGLINQGAYAFSRTTQMKPFRTLLKPSTKFVWTEELTEAFEQSKEVIIREMRDGVRLFDPSRLTCLSTDWSVDGIGFFMMQKYCECASRTPACCPDGWKLCLVGSRFTHPAESRYAPIEGEALAVVYALHQTRYYVLGCEDLIVATDHKPLLQILNDRSLTEIDNRRLLNLKEKTLGYRFTVVHVPGKRNLGPDAASRYPTRVSDHLHLPGEPDGIRSLTTAISSHDVLASLCLETADHDDADDESILAAASSMLHSISTVVTWDMVREATASDPTLHQLALCIEQGFPEDSRDLPPELRAYHRLSPSLCVVDGVILMGQRVVIPSVLQGSILSALHAAHQGTSSMQARAMDSVYWPNITVDIARTRDQCSHCHKITKSNPMQPPLDIVPPEFPFQQICADYFTYNNQDYVVIVDRYSNWPMVYRSESGAEGLVKRLRETFVTFGIPEEITSDGGPQFTAGKTRDFLEKWGVRHRLCSVANPHANSRAELAVKTVKRMLADNSSPTGSLDTDKFQRALLVYRNSIDPETKASPALILFGRPIRDPIPILMGRYQPHDTWKELLTYREKALAKRHSREHEMWTEHTRTLPPLRIGDHVYIQNLVGNQPRRWERTGVVIEVRQFHQYVIRVDGTGRVTLRNRQHLRKFTPFMNKSPSSPVYPPTVPVSSTRPHEPSNTVHQPPGPHLPPPILPSGPSQQPSFLPPSIIRQDMATDVPPDIPPQPQQHTVDPVIETDPPVQDIPPFVSPRRTPEVKLPRALARLQPFNKAGEKELLPPRRPNKRSND